MGSNFNVSFDERLRAHFTASELVEFLDLSVDDIIDSFEHLIYEVHYKELKNEIGQ